MHRRALCTALLVACSGSTADDLQVASVSPDQGTVEGGTRLSIRGRGFAPDATILLGDVPCEDVTFRSTGDLECTTPGVGFAEDTRDVVVANPDGSTFRVEGGFEYRCPWETSTGRRSCGAAPPASVPEQTVAAWVTQFEEGHGWQANAGAYEPSDTTDFVLGDRSAKLTTDGAGTVRTLTRVGLPPIDFTAHMPKLWVKLDGVEHVGSFDLYLGRNDLDDHYRFRLHSSQAQQWMTDGDWVAFTVPWGSEAWVSGDPDRARITDVRLRIVDDGKGAPVTLHANGLALVPEMTTYPKGLVSFTFDNAQASQATEAAPRLARRGYRATAYAVIGALDGPGRLTQAQLRELQDAHGWEIAVGAYTDDHHSLGFASLPPDVLEEGLVEARAWLMRHGFRGHDHVAYPHGEFDGAVLDVVGRYFATGRTIYSRQHETYPPSDRRKLRVELVTAATPIAELERAVDRAYQHREWVIFVFQGLAALPERSTEYRLADFEALLDHVERLGMPVMPVGEVR